MANPLLNNNNQQLNSNGFSNNPQMNEMKQLYQMFTKGGNPTQMFMQMASKNPQMQPILQMLQGGANPEQLVRTICQKRGIDFNEFMKSIIG